MGITKNWLMERVSVNDVGCWVWQRGRHAFGYGEARVGAAKKYAHRISWELHRGPIQLGMHVLHRCDNPPCCNPEHLFLGTQADNMRDMTTKGRHGDNGLRGEGQSNAKLTNELVRMIRSSSLSQRRLAKELGVSQSLIGMVRTNKAWRHV